jgi:16S rRNA (guanine966-N2)-methyltransferase
MRVVAGAWRGRELKSPTWEGVRPTSDRLRETLFNVLGPSIDGARVLDAYAGTGAIGIEALSRGAAWVTFVDRDARAVRHIAAALDRLAADRRYAIIRAGFAEAFTGRPPERFDVIVADPPYAADAVAGALEAAAPRADGETRVVVEHATRYPAPALHAGLALRRTLTAGDSALSFYT